jgi:hypothetical protein
MAYVEEREFQLRFELRCEFPDDYQGEEDGYAWAEEWPAIAAEILRQAVASVTRNPGWSVRTKNRGRSSEDEVTLVLDRRPR